jgi:hypothetical protein
VNAISTLIFGLSVIMVTLSWLFGRQR